MRYQITKKDRLYTITDTQTGKVIIDSKSTNDFASQLFDHDDLIQELDDFISSYKADEDYIDLLPIRRCTVATGFYLEQSRINGSPVYKRGNSTIPLDIPCMMLMMAGNIDGALIADYGPVQGAINAIHFYFDMTDIKVNSFLTPLGRQVMSDMFNHFIDDLEAGKLNNSTVH